MCLNNSSLSFHLMFIVVLKLQIFSFSGKLYVVEKLIGTKEENRSRYFLVKWRNYEEPTWEPEENIPKDIVQNFILSFSSWNETKHTINTRCWNHCMYVSILKSMTAWKSELLFGSIYSLLDTCIILIVTNMTNWMLFSKCFVN